MSRTPPRPLASPSGSKTLSVALYLLLTFVLTGAAKAQAPTVEPVDWTNRVKVSVSNGALTKDPQQTEAWDGGASSAQKIESGDGYVEFTAGGQTNTWRMCGLSNIDADAHYESLDYAIYLRADGKLHIFEKGIRKQMFNALYGPNETFRVAVEGGRVKYYWGGTLIYTSRVPPVFPLVADSAIYSNGGAIANAVIARHLDESGPSGTWYLKAARGNVQSNPGVRLTVAINDLGGGQYQGTMTQEGGATHVIDSIGWNPSTRFLQFRRVGGGWWQWFRGTVVEGVLAGRYTASSASASQPPISAFTGHVTGWNSAYIDAGSDTPRAYELLINNGYRAKLRIDGPAGARTGRLKVYSAVWNNSNAEELEDDVEIINWDGTSLQFVRHLSSGAQTYSGTASGRTISGTFMQAGDPAQYPWSGARADVLTYALNPKTSQDRGAWQTRTRRRLLHLMMGGNPAATGANSRQSVSVIPMTSPPPGRDDNAAAHPQNYTLEKVTFAYTFPDPYGGNNIQRNFGGYLAVPTSTPPPGGWPAAVVVNGHAGSARQTMDPNNGFFWYGDAMARRGYVVLAIDISHRPSAHTRGLYVDGTNAGDSPNQPDSNGPRPAVVSSVFAGTGFEDSDWEEDGERAWDVMRGIDYLLSLTRASGQAQVPLVDDSRVLMTGLSMGGEVTMIVSALDHRISLGIPAGYSPDMGVMSFEHATPYGFNMNHPCWRWLNADIREYVDASDYFALVAPRPLIIETGKQDLTFSVRAFAADKQVARRARVAYNDASSKFLHYLHYDQHRFHAGDVDSAEPNVRVPTQIAPPTPFSTAWQSDPATQQTNRTLFGYIQCYLDVNCSP